MTVTRPSRLARRFAVVLLGAVLGTTVLGVGTALAFFSTSDSSNPVVAAASALSAPTTPGATATDGFDITVSWQLPSSQISGARYQVTRTAPGTPAVVCTVDPNVTSCADSNLVPGTTYSYSIDAVLAASSWQSAAITASATTPKLTPGITTLTDFASLTVGGSVNDEATFSGGYSPTGTITWNLYQATDTTCTGAGVFTSSGQAVDGTSEYTSSAYTTTQPGSYIWAFVYSGDASNNTVTVCGGTGESVTVNQAAPTISTSAASSVSIGSGLTDTATLANGYQPTGTITFTLYGPSASPSCTASNEVGQQTTAVSGNGSYTSPAITPTQAGTYYWVASYGGDGNNQGVADTCGTSGETSSVNPVTPVISTSAQPPSIVVGGSVSDQATLQQGYSPTGTLTWSLFGNSTCSGTPVFTSQAAAVSGNSNYSPTNSYTTTSPGTYTWRVSYSGDNNNNPVTECGGTNETLTVTQATPTITVGAPATGVTGVSIANTVISASLGSTYSPASGTITFTVFGPSASAPTTCTSGGTAVGTASVTGSGTYNPNAGFTPSSAGNYWWYASYDGDANNAAANSGCGAGMAETLVSAPALALTSASPGNSGNNARVEFSGTGTGGGSVTVTICTVNTFPCPANKGAGKASATVAADGTWQTQQSDSNLSAGTLYYAQAVQTNPGATSSVLSFTAETKSSTSVTISAPSATTCYYNSNSSSCTAPESSWPTSSQIKGTASDSGGPGLQSVQVAIKNPSGMWWNGSSFGSTVPVYVAATGTGTWTYSISAAQLGTTTGPYVVDVTATDTDNETGTPPTTVTFTWKD